MESKYTDEDRRRLVAAALETQEGRERLAASFKKYPTGNHEYHDKGWTWHEAEEDVWYLVDWKTGEIIRKANEKDFEDNCIRIPSVSEWDFENNCIKEKDD